MLRFILRCISLGALVSLASVAACDDDTPPSDIPFTGSAFDAGGGTDNGGPDNDAAAGLPDGDAGLPDGDAAPIVTLATTSATVTAAGDVTLTATVTGATPTSVSFREALGDGGASSLGTDAEAPFTRTVSYSFLENGAHSYVAVADLGGGKSVTSDPITVTVNIAPDGFFVDPVNGADTSSGTQAAPFKTIEKARTSLAAGQTIYLAPGTYDGTTQSIFSFIFANPAFVRTLGGVATIAPPTAQGYCFYFSKGGGLRDVVLKNCQSPVQADGTGTTFVASNVLVDGMNGGGAGPFFMKGTVTATIDESMLAKPLRNATAGGGFASIVAAEGGATVHYKGGTFEDAYGPDSSVYVRGHATLTLEDVIIKNQPHHVITVQDNGHVTLENVKIQDSGVSISSGLDNNCIAMGGQNSEPPITTTLALVDSTMTGCKGSGVALSLYGNIASTPSITLTNSHIDDGTSAGIVAQGTSLSDLLTLTITMTSSTIRGNAGAGISTPRATVDVMGGAVSNNGGDGIHVGDDASVNTIKARGTTFDANAGDALFLAGTAASTLDLGADGAAGNLTFSNTNGAKSAVHLTALIAGHAVGDTWTPSQQGADAAGHYTTATTLSSTNGVGRNVNLAAGATLVVK